MKKQIFKLKRNCKVCDKEFTINNRANVYCSIECKNPQKTKALNGRLRAARRKDRLHQLYTIKKGCPDCGIKGPKEIYQFDHTDGSIGSKRLVKHIHLAFKRSLKKLFNELRNGEYICCNCHQLRTHKRKQFSKIKYI